MNTAGYNSLRQGLNIEDRESVRFVVPGATISWKRNGFWHPRNDFALEERLPVTDISRHGMSFLIDNPPKSSRISLLLQYSDYEDVIYLKGRVVCSLPRGIGHSYRYRIGVRFDPFSIKKGDNPIEALKILEKLEKDHSPVNTSGPLNAQRNGDPVASLSL